MAKRRKAVKRSRKKSSRTVARRKSAPARISNISRGIPNGVNAISWLYKIVAIVYVVSGVLALFGASFVSSLVSMALEEAGLASAIAGAAVAMVGLMLIVLGAVAYLIGKGIREKKGWARVLALIISVIKFIGSLFVFGVLGIIVHGLIVWYLGFNEEANKYFR
jgi:hypothetical protein